MPSGWEWAWRVLEMRCVPRIRTLILSFPIWFVFKIFRACKTLSLTLSKNLDLTLHSYFGVFFRSRTFPPWAGQYLDSFKGRESEYQDKMQMFVRVSPVFLPMCKAQGISWYLLEGGWFPLSAGSWRPTTSPPQSSPAGLVFLETRRDNEGESWCW